MPVFNNALAGAAGSGGAAGYEITRSLRFNGEDSAHLERDITTVGNQRKMTFSFWIKRNSVDSSDESMIVGQDYDTVAGNHVTARSLSLHFSGNQLKLYDYGASTGSGDLGSSSAWTPGSVGNGRLFRDPSAWYHCVFAIDTTQATAADRCKVWINGESQTYSSQPPQNVYLSWGQVRKHYIGIQKTNGSFTRAGNFQLSEFHFIDGQQLTASDFGEPDATTGVWNPIEYTGTYGTNGFHLDFSDNSSTTSGSNTGIGKDTSGNGNYFDSTNISVASGAGNDSLIDTPTDYTAASGNNGGNYATWNPLNTASNLGLANGNLDTTSFSGSSDAFSYATIGVSSGKWYYEATPTTVIGSAYYLVGWGRGNSLTSNGSDEYMWFSAGALRGASSASYGASWTANDVIGVALDLDAGNLVFYKNGVSQGTAFTGITGTVFPKFGYWHGNGTFNFGQRPFAYTPPTGFKSLCTQNLDDPTIADGSTAMDVALYTGNDGTQTISGLNFSPDLLWIKSRSATYSHRLFDTIRGVSDALYSNSTDAEGTYQGVSENLTAFTSDGFSLGSTSGTNGINQSTTTYVAWTWDAGASTVSNTDGSITSSVRANQSAGVSIVTWTGNSGTVGHGLNAVPGLIIAKIRNTASAWPVQHSYDTSQFLTLNTTDAASSDTTRFGAAPTSSVFSVGSWWNSDSDGVAYCFAPVEGYSAFGSYTGNGLTDGPFVNTGFRPRFLMLKSTSSGDWFIVDTKRDPFNGVEAHVYPNQPAQEVTGTPFIDILSNGFKYRFAGGGLNTSGHTIIYAAFAEHPFKAARAR